MTSRRQFGSIRRLPSDRWQARYREPLNNRLLTAPTTFATKADADRYLATVEADITRGVWHDPRHGDLTFAEWGTAIPRRRRPQGGDHSKSG